MGLRNKCLTMADTIDHSHLKRADQRLQSAHLCSRYYQFCLGDLELGLHLAGRCVVASTAMRSALLSPSIWISRD